MSDFKKEAARAALPFIKKNSSIGLGAGNTIRHLIEFIKEDETLVSSLTITTSSFSTKTILTSQGFTIQDAAGMFHLDMYFDGCDQFDHDLNAMKSGGGIHTLEKLLARMSSQFIILGDESKYTDRLNATYPLVVELIPEALAFVLYQLKLLFPLATASLRTSDKKDGPVVTQHGNYLIDVTFTVLPDPEFINTTVSGMGGVLEHSLFYKLAHQAIVAGPGGIRIMTRRDETRSV